MYSLSHPTGPAWIYIVVVEFIHLTTVRLVPPSSTSNQWLDSSQVESSRHKDKEWLVILSAHKMRHAIASGTLTRWNCLVVPLRVRVLRVPKNSYWVESCESGFFRYIKHTDTIRVTGGSAAFVARVVFGVRRRRRKWQDAVSFIVIFFFLCQRVGGLENVSHDYCWCRCRVASQFCFHNSRSNCVCGGEWMSIRIVTLLSQMQSWSFSLS